MNIYDDLMLSAFLTRMVRLFGQATTLIESEKMFEAAYLRAEKMNIHELRDLMDWAYDHEDYLLEEFFHDATTLDEAEAFPVSTIQQEACMKISKLLGLQFG